MGGKQSTANKKFLIVKRDQEDMYIVPIKLLIKTQLSHDTFLFRFELPQGMNLGIEVGNHCKLHAEINGEEVLRNYTPVTRTDQEGYFELVIKVYRKTQQFPNGGKMTQYLENLNVGDMIKVSGPIGRFTYQGEGKVSINRKEGKQEATFKKFGMISGGSGVTPMYQIARHILEDSKNEYEINFLYANKTKEDILIKSELEGLAEKYKHFKLFYTLDNPDQDWTGFKGFVSQEMIEKTMPSADKSTMILACGPPRMCENIKNALEKLGHNIQENFYDF